MNEAKQKPKVIYTEYVQLTYENFCQDENAMRSGLIEIEYENLSKDMEASLIASIANIKESIEAGAL